VACFVLILVLSINTAGVVLYQLLSNPKQGQVQHQDLNCGM
jgi:hypothetical protein